MSKRHTSYKSDTKHGFEAGELAALLAQHAGADYRVVISIRGKVRELIVEEERPPAGVECAADPETQDVGYDPVTGGPLRRKADDQEHGGKLRAALHDPRAQYPRTQDFRPEGQTFPAAPPWPLTAGTYPPGELTDEALNARFGDPRLSNLDRRDGLK